MKKLRSASGETLIETLAALIVATLVLLFLSTSIVAASRINKKVQKTDTSFTYAEEDPSKADSVTVVIKDDNNIEKGSVSVYSYTDDTGYYNYYKGANADE